ncbi:MAG: hypothetical protein Q7T36_14310 [Fluviicoccus sp.]|uniref:hypothetical protein n=1 Tax=Fluviicoccus sp. TaxID=2003552 RepID=UPI0027254B3A|nr:hypothetical protein [Fluviicoccus sp.]MDO8331635.1 hypothetical protein [Fluviicoccus sp.]
MMLILKLILLAILFPLHVGMFSFSSDESLASIIIGASFAIYVIPCIRYYLIVQRVIRQGGLKWTYLLAGTAIIAAALFAQFIPREYRVSDEQAVSASPFTPEWANVSGTGYGWPASVYVALERDTSCCGRVAVFYGVPVFNAVFPAAALLMLAWVTSVASRLLRKPG